MLTLSTLLITYFSYFKYKDLIVEQLALNRERLLFGFNNDTSPNLIVLGNNPILIGNSIFIGGSELVQKSVPQQSCLRVTSQLAPADLPKWPYWPVLISW